MSIAMSRPVLPKSSDMPSLPPLSSLLNAASPRPHSEPTSPRAPCSTDLLDYKVTTLKTPVRLPSFDSLQFDKVKPDATKHSHSFSGPVGSLTPAPIPLVTPVSQPQGTITESQEESPLVEKRSFAFISHSPSTFPSHEPAIDNAQLARRKRRRTSPGELAILQTEFSKGQTPNRAKRLEIAAKVNMTEKAVQIWFQNRRQTLRRQSNSQREVHHLELPPQMPHGFQQPTPLVVPDLQQHQSQQPSSPTSSSPDANSLVTPSRPPRQATTNKSPTTLTFRLTKTPVKTESVMTPVTQSYRTRQKPVMRVNSQPATAETHSSPINKENISPVSSPDKFQSSPSKKRQPLAEISFDTVNRPKQIEEDAVANLLSLKNMVK
jgi:homeobox protein YOX1/YHP1